MTLVYMIYGIATDVALSLEFGITYTSNDKIRIFNC